MLVFFQDNGITFEEMKLFHSLVGEIHDVEMALSMYLAAGASITAGNHSSCSRMYLVCSGMSPFVL